MRKLLVALACVVTTAAVVVGQDITTLESIGPVASVQKTENTVTFSCRDKSQVQLTILAPDLVRVRAAFRTQIPAKDHSWAIAKDDWTTPRWTLSETSGAVIVSTGELEVVVRRAPLLIEFRDARTHQLINADERPMAYDANGKLEPGVTVLRIVI